MARDGSTLVIDTVVDCWMAPPFVAMQQKVIASGITDDLARELALAIGERWIDAILPFQESS